MKRKKAAADWIFIVYLNQQRQGKNISRRTAWRSRKRKVSIPLKNWQVNRKRATAMERCYSSKTSSMKTPTTNLNKNKSTSLFSLFTIKSLTARRTAKKLQMQTANSYGSYSNLFSSASYGSMCSVDKAGKKDKKKNSL